MQYKLNSISHQTFFQFNLNKLFSNFQYILKTGIEQKCWELISYSWVGSEGASVALAISSSHRFFPCAWSSRFQFIIIIECRFWIKRFLTIFYFSYSISIVFDSFNIRIIAFPYLYFVYFFPYYSIYQSVLYYLLVS